MSCQLAGRICSSALRSDLAVIVFLSSFLPTTAMFVHAVYFWLRPDLTPAQRTQFAAGVRSLGKIESVQQCYIGVPASTDRPVIDRSYSKALVVVFDDEAGHDAYQVHPVHERFRTGCGSLWTRVQIFDFVSQEPATAAAAG